MVKGKLSPGIPLLLHSTSVHRYRTSHKQGLDGTARESLLLLQVAHELLRITRLLPTQIAQYP